MYFGIVGFLSNNVMLPILDFFYGIVHSYGLAIIFLTLVIRVFLYPLNATTIRNMRKMRIINPAMRKEMSDLQERYRNEPDKMREAQSKLYSKYGVNPLGGCLPLLVQMPILIALFATLRGSPFTAVTYDLNLHILPREVAAEVVPSTFSTDPKNIFLTESLHKQIVLTSPKGQNLGEGETTKLFLQGEGGKLLNQLVEDVGGNLDQLTTTWTITKGEDLAQIKPDGTLVGLQPGDITVQAAIPGLAADTGFLFISKLGHVGAIDPDGTLHWDVIAMILIFGVSIYLNQALTGQGAGADPNDSQKAVNKFTPVLFSGMFLFFPLPAGVLLYILVSNVFQTAQTYLLSLEPLPENLQKLVEEEQQVQEMDANVAEVIEVEEPKPTRSKSQINRDSLPFER